MLVLHYALFILQILKKIYNILFISIIFVAFVVISKNFIRIYENYEIRNEWPNIYSLSEKKEDNYKKQLISIYNKDNFVYYFSDKENVCITYLRAQIF